MASPKIAIILYTVREAAKTDLAGALQRVRDIGFEYVQWSGMPSMPAEAIREALDAAGLQAIAAHCPMEPFEQDFEGQVAYWKTAGVLDVAPGVMMQDCRDNLAAWLRGAERLDALGEKLRKTGMRLSYHNHAYEFTKFDGDARYPLDILFDATAPENLYAELDVAWATAGGEDPAAYIRRYAGRCPLVHMKDLADAQTQEGKPVFVPLGAGRVDWDAVFNAVKESGVEWCIYEQDDCQGDVFEAIQTSYDFLRKNL